MLAVKVVAVAAMAAMAEAQDGNCSTVGVSPFEALAKPLGACSGHGQCVEGMCVCDAGWTGLSDMVNLDGVDCQVNEALVKVLWLVNLGVHLAVLAQSAPRIRLRYQRVMEQRAIKISQGRRFMLRSNRGALATVTYFSVCWTCGVLFGISRLAIPDQRIGIDVWPTLLFAFAKLGFYATVYAFQPAVLATVLKGRSASQHLVDLYDRLTLGLTSFAVLLGFMPFITVSTGTDRSSANLAVWYLVLGGTGLQLVLFGLQARYINTGICKILDKSFEQTQNTALLDTKEALSDIQGSVVRQAVVQSSILFLFSFAPILLGKHDYLLPIYWCAMATIGKRLAFTQVDSSAASSAGARSTEYVAKHELEQSDNSALATSRQVGSVVMDGTKYKIRDSFQPQQEDEPAGDDDGCV